MRLCSTLALLVVCLALHLSPGAAKTPERRVALVIGNAHYLHLPQLATPLDDAEAMATTLSHLGFNVRLEYDVSRQAFSDALRGMAADARGADIAIIYFAGSVGPTSSSATSDASLLPVDAAGEPGSGTGPAAIRLSQVTNALSGAKTRLLFLDIVRSDRIAGQAILQPYPGQFARSVGRGASVIVADQSLEAATGGGTPLSPFTNALVETLPDPDLDLTEAFRQITQRVLRASGGQQQVASVGQLPARGIHLAPPPGLLERIVTLGLHAQVQEGVNVEVPLIEEHEEGLRNLEVRHDGAKAGWRCPPQSTQAAPPAAGGPQSDQDASNCPATVSPLPPLPASGGAPAPPTTAAPDSAAAAVGSAVPSAAQQPGLVHPWQLKDEPLPEYGATKLAPPAAGPWRSPAATTTAPPIAALPEFPWPPPSPSAELVLPGGAIGPSTPATLGAAADRLVAALQAADYLEYSFYHVPDGFALVARLERITADGRPMPAEFRYVPPDASAPFSFADYIRSLFFAPEGYYRLIAFVATDTPFVVAAGTMNVTHAEALLRGGANTLPAEWRAQPFTAAHAVTALIYEYRKGPQDGAVTTLIPSPLAAETHLVRANIRLVWSGQP